VKTVRFILAVHNHQPVGNFDHVFRKACDRAYKPFLDVFDEFPAIRMALHFSGPLLEWIEANDPALADRIKEGVRTGRFELLGGGFGEPILAMLTDRDLVGQIKQMNRYIRERYETAPRGIWLAERVWESQFASLLADAGVQYTVVDDFHFLAAGLREDDLTGYFTVEDKGRILRIFSGSEFLRYAIPFGKPADTIGHLRRFATEEGENLVVYADDGEKFGLWPETYKHVYEKGWLRDFAAALNDNADWVRFETFADTLDSLPPAGRAYLPDASYREMTEWARHVPAQIEFFKLEHELEETHLLKRCRPFLRGATWRNFKAKYTEAAQMYARMLEVSRRVGDRAAAKKYPEARLELYRGQCNCAYWHGVFAGLYMPFLRSAVYRHLINAENLVTPARLRPGRESEDFDLDGRPEIKLRDKVFSAYIKPDRGAALYELDHHPKSINLTDVVTRRREAYHTRLLEAVRRAQQAPQNAENAVSIHERVRWKEPGLEKLLFYDAHIRDSLIDHFFPAGTKPDDLCACRAEELGDFAGRPYTIVPRHGRSTSVTFQRAAFIRRAAVRLPLTLTKRISLRRNGLLEVRYALQFPEGAPPDTLFAVECNFALSGADAPDRNFFSHRRENLNNLTSTLHRVSEPSLGMVDEWLGLELWLHVDPPAGFWTYPVETVNDSEEGFERIHQGSAILPYWPLSARPGEEQICAITLEARVR